MNMKSLLAGALIGALVGLAFAGSVLAQSASPATVNFSAVAEMPTLGDAKKLDSFMTNLHDAQVDTTIVLSCSAGHSQFLGLAHANKTCAFEKGSSGLLFNPKKSSPTDTKTWLPRTQYLGQYIVTADGTTDAKSLVVSYSPNGVQSQFGGSLNLKPELTSSGATALKDLVLKKLQSGTTTPIDDRVDTVDFNNFYVPSAGLPSDKGCTWQGNAVFPYQVFAWYWKVSAICGDARYDFTGSQPFLGDSSAEGTTTYNILLTLAGADAQTDDALFADSADDSLFQDTVGISGTLTMTNSHIVTVTLDNEPLQTPQHVDTKGTITGNGVPLPVVRSFATLIALLPSTFFGA